MRPKMPRNPNIAVATVGLGSIVYCVLAVVMSLLTGHSRWFSNPWLVTMCYAGTFVYLMHYFYRLNKRIIDQAEESMRIQVSGGNADTFLTECENAEKSTRMYKTAKVVKVVLLVLVAVGVVAFVLAVMREAGVGS